MISAIQINAAIAEGNSINLPKSKNVESIKKKRS